MRIVIESEENVVAEDVRLANEQVAANVIDGGPAPAALLRQFGRVPDSASDVVAESPSRRRASRKQEETSLNPLRSGEAVARGGSLPKSDMAEPTETLKGGAAPKIKQRHSAIKPRRGSKPKAKK